VVALRFLESANFVLNKDGLYKRSIVLIKAWCLYETRILGSHNASLCSYAIELMILYVLNNHFEEVQTPFDVLRLFVHLFARFNWSKCLLTIYGPIAISTYSQLLQAALSLADDVVRV
jgi:hypothetical protein